MPFVTKLEHFQIHKAYKYKGVKFTKTGGNSWLSKYNITLPTVSSAIFVEYKASYINFAKNDLKYRPGDYESDILSEYALCSGNCAIVVDFCDDEDDCVGPSNFSSSEIEDAWIDGVVIVQSTTLVLSLSRFIISYLAPAFDYETYEFQDNFSNIVAIEFDWDLDPGELGVDWKVKRVIVLYP